MSSSPLKVEKDSSMAIEKKGIVTILGSDSQLNKAASSLRRTLSADMSSKKWLAQNGISSMKRISSSQELSAVVSDHSSSSSDGEDELDQKPTHPTNVSWSSILLAGKTNDDSNNNGPPPPPYIHPLAKKPATLNEKSLEICTESLGSETGSDCFSSYPHSETSDVEEEADKEEVVEQQIQKIEPPQVESIEEFPVAKYNYNPVKKLPPPPRSFPPPLPSIASKDGPSLQMQSHRENGRLVLEAVSMPQMNYFHAERQEGRLRLSLTNNCQEEETEEDEVEVEEFEEVFDNIEGVEKNDDTLDDEDEEDEEEEAVEDEEEIAFVIEQSSISPSNAINMHKSGVVMKRLMRLDNDNNPKLSNKLNKEDPTPLTVARLISSPSPPSTTAAAASFNVYEYFWRKQPSVSSIIDPFTQCTTPLKYNKAVLVKTNTTPKAYKQQDMVVMRRCKDRRHLLTVHDAHCIATP